MRVVDPELTPLGLKQAEALAHHLAHGLQQQSGAEGPGDEEPHSPRRGFSFTRLYCSPMWRSLQTAYCISESLGLQPEVWIDVHELGGMFLDQGDPPVAVPFPGRTRQQILRTFRQFVVPDTITDTGWYTGAGMEDLRTCDLRAQRVLESLRAFRDSNEHIAIVSHGAFMNRLLHAMLGSSVEQFFYLHWNTGITSLDFRRQGKSVVRYINDISHLPPELVAPG